MLSSSQTGDTSMINADTANSLKHRALEVFAKHGNLNPAAWAVLAPMYPIRSAYTYLLRLHKFGLLNRNRDANGLLIYSLSARGAERLAWFRTQLWNTSIQEGHNK
jgi:hypothetical protein